jgi:hypothetical protein
MPIMSVLITVLIMMLIMMLTTPAPPPPGAGRVLMGESLDRDTDCHQAGQQRCGSAAR